MASNLRRAGHFLLLLPLLACLCACGQKGSLYAPGDQNQPAQQCPDQRCPSSSTIRQTP